MRNKTVRETSLGMSGASILVFLRGRPHTWKELCVAFELDPENFGSLQTHLFGQLEALKAACLIEYATTDDRRYPGKRIEGSIQLQPIWASIQRALGVSLRDLAMLEPGRGMAVEPTFGVPLAPVPKVDLFVLMPFKPELKTVYDDHILKVAGQSGQTPRISDRLSTSDTILFVIRHKTIGAGRVSRQLPPPKADNI